MSRLTLRLPDTLHQEIETRADTEGVSMNQYIVFALTRQVTQDYTVQPVDSNTVGEQRAQYQTLLDTLGRASFTDIQRVLDEREPAGPERGLTPEVVARLRERLAANSGK